MDKQQKPYTEAELDAIYNDVSNMHTALTGCDDHGNVVEPVADVTVAVEEPISDVARIRLELEELSIAGVLYNSPFDNINEHRIRMNRFTRAQSSFYIDVAAKVKALLAVIDAQARELEAAKKATSEVVKNALESFIDVINTENSDTPAKDARMSAFEGARKLGYQIVDYYPDNGHYAEWVAEKLDAQS